MLNFNEKLEIFNSILEGKEISYADSFNEDISINSSNYDYMFLEKLNSKKEIELWITKIKSRIVMKEDEDTVENIIEDYILYG